MHPLLYELEPRFAELDAELATVDAKRTAILDRVAADKADHERAIRRAIDAGERTPIEVVEDVTEPLRLLEAERGRLQHEQRELLHERALEFAARLREMEEAELQKAAEIVEQLRPAQARLVDLSLAYAEVQRAWSRRVEAGHEGIYAQRLDPAVDDVVLTELVRGALGGGSVISRSPLRDAVR